MTGQPYIQDADLTDPDAMRQRIRALQKWARHTRDNAGRGVDRGYFEARAADFESAAGMEARAAALLARLQAMGEALDPPDTNRPEQAR
jgi:hypothetical protein